MLTANLRCNKQIVVMKWQVSSGSWPRTALSLIVDPIVSAFAARKAVRRPTAEVTSRNEVQTSLGTETYDDPLEGSKPPRKKQKWGSEHKNRDPQSPQQIDGLADVRHGSLDDGMKDIENGEESDSSSISEPENLAQSMTPVQRLSTFDLSKSKVLMETDTEWTIRLHPNDVSIWPDSYYALQDLRFT